MTNADDKRQVRDEALTKLREMLPPGSTVRTVMRHVSSSGMTRDISPVVVEDGRPVDISYLVVRLDNGWKFSPNNGGIRMGGAGMDMGFALVYALSRYLYPDGFDCIQYAADGRDLAGDDRAKWCRSNDHSNLRGAERTRFMHHGDGGYALRHDWL